MSALLKTLARQNPKAALGDYRYEIKMPLDRMQFENLLPNLYKLGLYPSMPFPDRRINSVYYDSDNFSDYIDNTSGIGARRKTRIRWYNGDMSKLTLEQKIKSGKASRKETEKLRNDDLTLPHTMDGTRQILAQNAATIETLKLAQLRPVLEVQYDRQYFTLGHDLRMTIDLKQKFRRLHGAPARGFVASPVYAVIEFKYPAPVRPQMQSMLRNLPYRIFRHSKYVIGLEVTAA